jgi:hypothetical protein
VPFVGSLSADVWNVEITPAGSQLSGVITFHFLKPGIADLQSFLLSGQIFQTAVSFPPNTSFFCIEALPTTGGMIGQLRLIKGSDIRTVDLAEDAKFVWQVIWP